MKLYLNKLLLLLATASPLVGAQVATVCESLQPYGYDSGDTGAATTTISIDSAPWIQLDLSGTNLAAGATLTLKGEKASQVITANDFSSTNGFSVVFDGSSVDLELSTPGGVRGVTSRVLVKDVKVGLCRDDVIAESICGDIDDRIPSTDVRVGRIGGCTGWLISEDVFIQAGHCGTPSSSTRLHFVYGTGSAAPEDQYAVDISSYRFKNGGVGNDWGSARLLPNSVTGKLPGVAQSEKCGTPGCGWYNLGAVPSTTDGNNIRITGYGTADVDSRSQKTHVGALTSIASTSIRYVPDTTGGNSGSPVIHEETGDAVGVHTHGGCGATSGSNLGTRIDVPEFAAHVDFLTKDCTQDSHCDDGVFCNGVEVCNAGKCEFGAPVTCDDGLSCTDDICDEAAGMCVFPAKTCSEPGATGQCSEPAGCEYIYGATLETWTGISGTLVSNLMSATNNLSDPPNSSVRLGSVLEGPTNVADNYGQRIKGWLVAPETGDYTFWISSDDEGQLFLSSNDDPANKSLIANVPGWSSSREWTKFAAQQSVQIPLIAGKAYYMEALMKEGGGGDNLAVAWAYGAQTQQVIPADHMRMEKPQTASPTHAPTNSPTNVPTTAAPTHAPTPSPTTAPTTASPTNAPTTAPPTHPPTLSQTNAPTTPSPTASPTTASPTNAPTQSPPTNSPTAAPTSACGDITDKNICQGTNGRCEWINGKNSGCFDAASPPSPSPPSPTPPSCECGTINDNKACGGCDNCSWSGKDKVCLAL